MNRRRAIPIPFLVPGVLRRNPPGLGFLPSFGTRENAETGSGSAYDDYWGWGMSYDWANPYSGYQYNAPAYDYGYQDPGGYGPGDTIYMPPTIERLPLPKAPDWDPLHLFTPWLYDPGIYEFTYDPGIPPVPRGTTTPRRPTTPTTPTAPRRPSPGSGGTTRPTPQNQQCRKPFIYDAKTKKCLLPPCPEGQAFSISQNKCVPIPQLTAEDEVKEPFPWWLVVLIGTGLVIATSRPKK